MSLGQHPGVPNVDSLQVLGEQEERELWMLKRHPNCPVFSAREGPRLGIQFPMSAAGAEHPCCKRSIQPATLLLTHCVNQGVRSLQV